MKKDMPLEGLRWSRDSGSALYDTPQTAVLGRAVGGQIYKKIAIVFENDKCIGCMLFVSVLIICLLIGHIIQNLTKHILNICCNEK